MLDYCEDCEIYKPCDCSAPDEPPFYCVSIYLIDKAFGGNEEGGWYYDCGEPCVELGHYTRIFDGWDEADEYADQLNDGFVSDLNEGRPSISSVLSEGRSRAIIDEGHYPRPYPERTPRYE